MTPADYEEYVRREVAAALLAGHTGRELYYEVTLQCPGGSPRRVWFKFDSEGRLTGGDAPHMVVDDQRYYALDSGMLLAEARFEFEMARIVLDRVLGFGVYERPRD